MSNEWDDIKRQYENIMRNLDPDGEIVFSVPAGEVLRLSENGDIFIYGRLAENDAEVVGAMRAFIAWASTDPTCILGAQAENGRLTSEVERLRELNNELENEVVNVEVERDQMLRMYDDVKSEADALRRELEEKTAEIAGLEGQLAAVRGWRKLRARVEELEAKQGHWTRESPTEPGWYKVVTNKTFVAFAHIYQLGNGTLMVNLKMANCSIRTHLEDKYLCDVWWWSEPERLPEPPEETNGS